MERSKDWRRWIEEIQSALDAEIAQAEDERNVAVQPTVSMTGAPSSFAEVLAAASGTLAEVGEVWPVPQQAFDWSSWAIANDARNRSERFREWQDELLDAERLQRDEEEIGDDESHERRREMEDAGEETRMAHVACTAETRADVMDPCTARTRAEVASTAKTRADVVAGLAEASAEDAGEEMKRRMMEFLAVQKRERAQAEDAGEERDRARAGPGTRERERVQAGGAEEDQGLPLAGGVVKAEVERGEEAHKETPAGRDMPGNSARWLDQPFWYELVEAPWRLVGPWEAMAEVKGLAEIRGLARTCNAIQTQTEDCVWEIVEDDLEEASHTGTEKDGSVQSQVEDGSEVSDETLQHLKENQSEHDTKVDAEKLMDVSVASGASQQDGGQEERRGVKRNGCFRTPLLGARRTCSSCGFDVCGRCFEEGWSACPMYVEHQLERRTPEESRLEVLGHLAAATFAGCEVRSLNPNRREDFFRRFDENLGETAGDRLERVVRAYVEAHTVPWDEDRDKKADNILEVLAAQGRDAEEWLGRAKHLLMGTCDH